jgi:hypothetical protein
MALCFFHLRDGKDVLLDPEGREFDDQAVIAKTALAEARSIISHDALTGFIRLDQYIDVEDATGTVLHTVEFRDAVTILA